MQQADKKQGKRSSKRSNRLPDFIAIILKGIRVRSKLHELHLETTRECYRVFTCPRQANTEASSTTTKNNTSAQHCYPILIQSSSNCEPLSTKKK
jgi:hypothetical protein